MTASATHGQHSWIVDEIFRDELANGYKGFFIEAGASDGASGSNTLVLEKEYSWTGLLVEPNRKFFQRLASHRTSICKNVVLSAADGEIEFLEAGWYGTAPDLVQHIYNGALPQNEYFSSNFDGTPAETVKLQARALGSLLQEINAPSVIDYFSLDVEGGELSVLKGFDFSRYHIRAMTIETKYQIGSSLHDHAHRAPCRELLEAHGYRLTAELQYDDAYVFAG